MKTLTQLKKNFKKDYSSFKEIKIGLLGDSSTQFIAQAIRGAAYEYEFDLQIWEAGFNQIEHQIFDASSDLYSFNPEIVIIFYSSHKLLAKYNNLTGDECKELANNQINLLSKLYSTITSRIQSKVICFNYAEINDFVYGSYATKIESSFLFQLRKLNYEIMLFAAKHSDFFLIDMASIQSHHGKKYTFQSSIYIHADITLSIDIIPEVAFRIVDIIGNVYGRFYKCLILDLDNTLWGGTIGDDGLQNIQIGNLGIGKAFTEFQHWLKKLKNRGIILAICSKNTKSVAEEVFIKHPEMILRMEDISVFIANWDNKADNIKKIQSILNVGFDSMVFLDDNAFERNMIRQCLPDVRVPELPEDPADYLEFLYSLNLFEATSSSKEDIGRAQLYQTELKRMGTQQDFLNEDEYLKNLMMLSKVELFNDFNSPRAAQLSQRSNQFNLRTVRYTISDIEKMVFSNSFYGFTFTLEDKFGDNGLIAVIVLKVEDENTLFIENWFMSCRVLNRGMENFILNILIEFANKEFFRFLKGEYIQTSKNEIVKDHYRNLGFTKKHNYWTLRTDLSESKATHIKLKA